MLFHISLEFDRRLSERSRLSQNWLEKFLEVQISSCISMHNWYALLRLMFGDTNLLVFHLFKCI